MLLVLLRLTTGWVTSEPSYQCMLSVPLILLRLKFLNKGKHFEDDYYILTGVLVARITRAARGEGGQTLVSMRCRYSPVGCGWNNAKSLSELLW